MFKDEFLEIILKEIPSEDMREYLRNVAWNPSDEDIATILCNLDFPYMETIRILKDFSGIVSEDALTLRIADIR